MDCEEIAEGFLLKARTPGVNDVWAREVFVRKCSYLLTFVVDFWQFRSRSIITLTMLVSVFLNLVSASETNNRYQTNLGYWWDFWDLWRRSSCATNDAQKLFLRVIEMICDHPSLVFEEKWSGQPLWRVVVQSGLDFFVTRDTCRNHRTR